MVTKKFTCKEHEEHGFSGWVMNTMPHFDPGTGMTVAHDCLEHLSRREGLEGEMEAFGVSLWGRHQGGYWAGKRSFRTEWSYHVADEVAQFCAQAGMRIDKAPKAALLEDHLEAELAAMVEGALRGYPEQAEVYLGVEEDDLDLEEARRIFEECARWIRRGFHAAEKKYDISVDEFAELFSEIERRVDKIHPEIGDTLSVRFDRNSYDLEVIHSSLY
jgi:hypothetical protein